jgi:hypothetical protein
MPLTFSPIRTKSSTDADGRSASALQSLGPGARPRQSCQKDDGAEAPRKESAGGLVVPPALLCFSVAMGESPSAQTAMCSPVAERVPGTSAVAPSPLRTMLV